MRYLMFGLLIVLLLPVLGCDSIGIGASSSSPDAAPEGTFTGQSVGIKGTVTFEGNKATFYNEIGGNVIYEFALMRDGKLCYPGKVTVPGGDGVANQIMLRDHAMGTQKIASFKYLPSDKCVVIDGSRYYE